MNLPNKLSVLRLILIPVFAAFFYLTAVPCNYVIATVIFIVASCTDFLDGYIARKYHLVTNLGKFLDPIADKVLVSTALILVAGTIVLFPVVGVISVAVILARELIISGFRQVAAKTGFVMAADKIGKVKTTFQDVAIVALLLSLQFQTAEWLYVTGNVLLLIATVLTIVSGVHYIVKNRAVLKDPD